MINGCYNGLAGVTLTPEQSKQYNNAYGIAYTYNLPAPRMEDFATGNGEAIVDRYAELAYQKDPNKTGVSWCDFVKKRIAEITARNTATTAAKIATQPITGGQVVAAQRAAASVAQQAATSAATPATTAPATTTTEKKNNTIWWIVLGGAVAFGAYKLLSGGKKKRR